MGAWGTAIFSDDLAQDIRREYSLLLSTGKDNKDVEVLLTDYYSSILDCNNPDEDVFWFALALCEWNKGRLSSYVKAKALSAIESGHDLERWNTFGNDKNYKKRKEVLIKLKDVILSPQPPIKKVSKPTVHHCPWKVGSLLAYRIVTNKQLLHDHPCFMKYVLLRVVEVKKCPISKLFDTGYYDETMTVGLYNWIGSEIPDPKIVSDLEFISISSPKPKANHTIELPQLDGLPNQSVISDMLARVEQPVSCVQLDWLPTKNEKGDITYLGCDESYEHSIPEFFKTYRSCYIISHYLPFDVTLSKRFEALIDGNQNFDYLIV